jgi:hypothetical protein
MTTMPRDFHSPLPSCRECCWISFILITFMAGCTTSHNGDPSQAQPAKIQAMRMPFIIGDTNVHALVYQHGQPSPTFVNVHDDENTSVEAGKAVIDETSGRLIELAHGGRRHLRFSVEGEDFAVDPNRIFSDAGIRATLERQGKYSSGAHWAVERFARQFLERFALSREPVIVALHNTVDGNYSVESYRPGAQHAAAATDLHISTNRSRFDFFFVTDRRFFDYLKQRDFNVVLQDNAAVPDDGSLSVYFATKGIPYLNIETELGQLDRQIEMVRAARQMLDDLSLVKTK